MLKHLQYEVEINNPHRVLTGNHSFETGLTAITGQNGKGKSMKLEMVEFALFGTEALRGKMDDYKKLEVNMRFEINAHTWVIQRGKTKAALIEEHKDAEGAVFGETKASGTKAVNAKILELFGYSSSVFRVANLCNQGKIEELGDMKPTARKQLVDETVGLTVLDQLVAFIDEERKRLSTGIKAIEGILVEPQLPEDPKTGPSEAWKVKRDQMQQQMRQ
jgi:DNA repair exonuclease SbcCD ATPase subunit